MTTQVVTVSSREPHESYYNFDKFLASLARLGVSPTVLGMGGLWRGLMTKPFWFREWLRAGQNESERLIVCDSWDVVFTEHPDAVGARCAETYGNAVVFNGEKGCWPRGDLADSFPDEGSPWRFLNSGFMCGPAKSILEILEYMDIESIGFDPPGGPYPNDQGEFQRCFAESAGNPFMLESSMVVDSQCRIAQTLSACSLEEFDLSGERVRNVVTGTEPGVWHFNGDAKNVLMPAMLSKWGLA